MYSKSGPKHLSSVLLFHKICACFHSSKSILHSQSSRLQLSWDFKITVPVLGRQKIEQVSGYFFFLFILLKDLVLMQLLLSVRLTTSVKTKMIFI